MFNKEIIEKIIARWSTKNQFGSGKNHIYIKFNKEEPIEEEDVVLIAHDTVLEVCEIENETCTYTPYSQIIEICVVSDVKDE